MKTEQFQIVSQFFGINPLLDNVHGTTPTAFSCHILVSSQAGEVKVEKPKQEETQRPSMLLGGEMIHLLCASVTRKIWQEANDNQ